MKYLIVSIVLGMSTASASPFVFPGSWNNNVAGKPGGIYRESIARKFTTVNPFTTNGSVTLPKILSAGGLFKRDPITKEYVPYMAESVRFSDHNKTAVVSLRDNLLWSDGKPITPQDWVWTMKLQMDPTLNAPARQGFFVDNQPILVEAMDEHTLAFHFPKATTDPLAFLAFDPWPAHVFQPLFDQKGIDGIRAYGKLTEVTNVVSSGPFVLSKFTGTGVELARNPYFARWNVDFQGQSLPYLDQVVYNFRSTDQEVLADFISGEADSAVIRTPYEKSTVENALKLQLRDIKYLKNVSPSLTIPFITFNLNSTDPEKSGLFKNLRFRRALSSLVDENTMIKLAYSGDAVPVKSMVHTRFTKWQSDLPSHSFSPSLAAGLLDQLGYTIKKGQTFRSNPEGKILDLDLKVNNNKERETMAKIFADNALSVGLKVNVKIVSDSDLEALLFTPPTQRNFDLMLYGVRASTNPSWPYGFGMLECDGPVHIFNTSQSCIDPAEQTIHNLQRLGTTEPDSKKAIALSKMIDTIYHQQVYFLYLPTPYLSYVQSDYITGEFNTNIADDITGFKTLATLVDARVK